jgi:predicted NBD/HSP70 family sugar kinase
MADIGSADGQGSRPRRRGGALQGLRDANLRRILEVISSQRGLIQAEVARRTELSPATVSNLVGELRQRGLVRIRDPASAGRATLEAVTSSRPGTVVGIDFGYRHLRVGLADLAGTVLADEWRPLPLDLDVEESSAQARAMIGSLVGRSGTAARDILHAGVGLPAPMDATRGRAGWHAILHRWADLDPRSALEDALELPVVVDNDCTLGALGELRVGDGHDCANFVYISVSTGVGAGLVLSGQVYRGSAGTAGEIGHVSVDPYGRTCRCGNRGCLDTIVGSPGFLELLRSVYGDQLEVSGVIDLAEQGDMRCRRALTDAGRALGAVVADLCNLLSPERFLLAGPIFAAGEMILRPLRETVEHRAVPAAARTAEIIRSGLDDRAEMLGAIHLALDAAVAEAGSATMPLRAAPG